MSVSIALPIKCKCKRQNTSTGKSHFLRLPDKDALTEWRSPQYKEPLCIGYSYTLFSICPAVSPVACGETPSTPCQYYVYCMFAGLVGLDLGELGIPSEDDVIEEYCRQCPHSMDDLSSSWSVYQAFTFFRVAAILQGVYKRALQSEGGGGGCEKKDGKGKIGEGEGSVWS